MKFKNEPSGVHIQKLLSLLEEVPVIERVEMLMNGPGKNADVDCLISVWIGKEGHTLACETKNSGQPRFVRSAVNGLRSYMYGREYIMTPVILAPYLSPDARKICRDNKISYMDMEGNARIQFGGVYIDHQMSGKPAPEKRGLRTMFSPKSAQVLRMMLNDPLRAWKVSELSEEGMVSLGHASNVRKNLLDREWAISSDVGLVLKNPVALVNEWRDSYSRLSGTKKTFYTPLHGSALESQLRKLLSCDEVKGYAVLASFSAAQWLSPFARTGMNYFYADEKGMERLFDGLKLSNTSKGANVTITVPKDPGIFLDIIEPADDIFTTGVVQTYLDLSVQGERGQEAAEHLRNEWMNW